MNDLIKHWVIPPVVGLVAGMVLVEYLHHRSSEPAPVATAKADAEVVKQATELEHEHIVHAIEVATSKRAAIAQRVQQEVTNETTGDGDDLAAWINARTGE